MYLSLLAHYADNNEDEQTKEEITSQTALKICDIYFTALESNN